MKQLVVVDFETFFTTEYSLSRSTTREYIMDPRFEVIGASIAVDKEPARWYDAKDLPTIFATFDWPNCAFVAHNTLFDGAIAAWKYGIKPKLWIDTMGMAQATVAFSVGGASLKKLSPLVNRNKDSVALLNMRGVRGADIDKDGADWARYITYANEDSETCRDLLRMLLPVFPQSELQIIDLLLRAYIEGKLELDRGIIEASLGQVRAEAQQALARAGIPDKGQLRSRDKFAALLQSRGVTPPTKINPKGESTYAFAKNDLNFTKLLEHDDPAVVALIEAKLNASSSLEETRAARLSNLSRIEGQVLNVPLKYYGAATGRMSGLDKLNLQNLPRNSPLRKAIKAPKGYKIVVVDASQIEARLLSWMAGCTALVDAFAAGEDVYSTFASSIFDQPVNKKDNVDERFVGKTGILGLGYGTGAAKFQWALLTSPFYDKGCTEDFAQKVVDTYRASYPEIPHFWKQCDSFLKDMDAGRESAWGPLKISRRRIELPNKLFLTYPQLIWQDAEEFRDRGFQYWSSKYRSWKKLYGAALTENIIQALARIIITDAMLAMKKLDPDYFFALAVHDELVYLVPEAKAEKCYHDLMREMCRVPWWADQSLPLAAEGGWGDRYSEVK